MDRRESEDRRREKREWFDKVAKRFRDFVFVFRGMILLPRLTGAGTLEQGRFCTGCLSGPHHEVLHFSENETGPSLSGYVSVPGCHFQTARLPAEFLAHFRRCPGARSIGSVALEASPALLRQISADDAGLVVLGTFATGNPPDARLQDGGWPSPHDGRESRANVEWRTARGCPTGIKLLASLRSAVSDGPPQAPGR